MTRKNLLMMAVLVALSGAGLACAQEQKADADGPRHAKIDANGDGFIDKTEAAKFPRLAEKFDELDKDKDGKLSKDELPFPPGRRHGPEGRHGPGPGRGFGPDGFVGRLDTDKDGRISREEAKADPRFAENFDKADVNKDGFVDKADFELRAKQRRDEIFDKADTDKNGVLSKAEFEAMKPEGPRGHGPGPGGPGPQGGPGGPGGDQPPPPPPEDAPEPEQP